MEKLWIILALVQLYVFCYMGALWTCAHMGEEMPQPWQVLTLLRETLGAMLRYATNAPTFCGGFSTVSIFSMLSLDPGDTSESTLLAAFGTVFQQMSQRPWTYPASQHRVLQGLATRAVLLVRQREAFRKARSDKANRSVPVQSVSKWRTVLGLGAHERNPDTVRRAYRKLASKAHPDRGGSSEDMAALSQAMAQARVELNFV